jgi:hypothetical protein
MVVRVGRVTGGSRQPTKDSRAKEAWYCATCGMVSETKWEAGTHADRREAGLNSRCDGDATGPYYLVGVDDFLDLLLRESGS